MPFLVFVYKMGDQWELHTKGAVSRPDTPMGQDDVHSLLLSTTYMHVHLLLYIAPISVYQLYSIKPIHPIDQWHTYCNMYPTKCLSVCLLCCLNSIQYIISEASFISHAPCLQHVNVMHTLMLQIAFCCI